jgi:hypothetical protein
MLSALKYSRTTYSFTIRDIFFHVFATVIVHNAILL